MQHPSHIGQDAKGVEEEAVGLRTHENLNDQNHAELQHPGHIGQDAEGAKGEAAGPRKYEDLSCQEHAASRSYWPRC